MSFLCPFFRLIAQWISAQDDFARGPSIRKIQMVMYVLREIILVKEFKFFLQNKIQSIERNETMSSLFTFLRIFLR